MSPLTESVRRAYQAFTEDPESMWHRFHEDAVFHVSGDHALSGDYVGLAEVRRYVDAVREATGGREGFSVTSALSDETGTEILVEGTALHREGPYVRTIVHLLRLADGKVVEFRDHPFDQRAEDRFWNARVPAQRDGRQPSGPTGSDARAFIPAQPTSTHITKG